MNSKLSYRLIYYPETDKSSYINYWYSDNKVHFKFLNINKKVILKGFEQKLNYLMTYLFNFSFAPTILRFNTSQDSEQVKFLVKEFINSPEIKEVNDIVSWKIGDCDFKGFKVLLNKKTTNLFGELPFSCAPLDISKNGLVSKGSLSLFLRKLKVDLVNFLFDDGYILEIYNCKKDLKINDKFIKKTTKKHNKITANVNSLW